MKDGKENVRFEESIRRLEEIAALIENPETPIETVIELYKEAAERIRQCSKVIDEAELQVKVLLDPQAQPQDGGETEAQA